MKAIGFAIVGLGLAVSAHATMLGLAPAAQPQEYYPVTITASPTVAITNAYLIYGKVYSDNRGVGNNYTQLAFAAVPLGTLSAATSALPDVLTVDVPQIWINDPNYASPLPLLGYLGAGWSIEALYAPGGVSITNTNLVGENGGWPFPGAPESTIATALANGDVNTLISEYTSTGWETSTAFGNSQPLMDYSNATPNGSVNAELGSTPVPEPTTAILMVGFGTVLLLRRCRANRPEAVD
jgi:hypothetical protein